ncbi:MarR family winged helix-turn-helix transcriptional regulator [Clostridium sp. LIBA-8841]|uniref:MarR family winged helix-turn-helix transcriptional regulator n=1 Tax=Clostridium sp. LIBA-8841 TaxID=2987530 RepID=UPI002AC67926|nr:MarR family transcriptional regulator [Clostridium sp. LIBA-8841]MDZ5254317.1 MarR family transcriptional regulator [Clostridium sp. LIBA-8841]
MDLKTLNPNGNAFLVSFTKAKKTYKKFISPTLSNLGLTHNEFEILVFLQENLEYNTAKDIVEFSGLSKGLISRSIEGLLKKEMLIIKKDEKDKRIVRLYISDSATKTIDVLNKISNEFCKLLLEGLKEEELAAFDNILNKMIKNLNNLKI